MLWLLFDSVAAQLVESFSLQIIEIILGDVSLNAVFVAFVSVSLNPECQELAQGVFASVFC